MGKQQQLWEEVDVGDESEDDLLEPKAGEVGQLSQAVVTGTDWTTETILNQLNKSNIELNPAFQRRNAWTPLRQSRFIESIILGLPIPQIVLAEQKQRRGKFIVIDGKQRLLTILQFAPPENRPIERPLRLSGLKIRADLNGKTFGEMQADTAHSSDIDTFQNQPIRTVVVKNYPDEQFLFTVFYRLNSGSVPLSPQELRQALHSGPFVKFVDEFTGTHEDLQTILNIVGPDFRMRDTELLVRFFAFRRFLSEYNGNLKEFLDMTCKRLNDLWPSEEMAIRKDAEIFGKAIISTTEIFGDEDAFSRWNGRRFERRFNRAVFDIMAYYFSDEQIARNAQAKPDFVKKAFKDLCEQDAEFSTALEISTKSIGATFKRLSSWGAKLKEVLEAEFRVPDLVNDRIVR